MVKITKSFNIALYPSLVAREDLLACAWYEYSSREEPLRSDIYFSISKDAKHWADPVNISAGNSYNNGPCLICSSSGQFILAWHSWREPGKPPFTKDGDICNIWVSRSYDGLNWEKPKQAFSSFPNTEYAAMSESRENQFIMIFHSRDHKALYISRSNDGYHWSWPHRMPEQLSRGKAPDLYADKNGCHYLAFTDNNTIRYSVSHDDGKSWSTPAVVITSPDGKNCTRPHISIDQNGLVRMAYCMESWGHFRNTYRICLKGDQFRMMISANKEPGNAFWVLNAIEFRSLDSNRQILYDIGGADHKDGCKMLNKDNVLYTKQQGYGFDSQVRMMIRELGDRITRTFAYSDRPTLFMADMEKGEYEVIVHYSSWIASYPGTMISIETDIISMHNTAHEHDSINILENKQGSVNTSYVFEGVVRGFDNNRPSKIVDYCTSKYIAWTAYGPDTVSICFSSL